MLESALGFVAVFILVLLRIPIAFAMGFVGMVGLVYEISYRAAISLVGRLIIDTSQGYGLSLIPLFILMGLFVNKGGISMELYRVSNAFLGHFRGGLAMATIVACGGFAAICGSSLATAATMSKVAMPEMRKYNYSDRLSSASIAAGGARRLVRLTPSRDRFASHTRRGDSRGEAVAIKRLRTEMRHHLHIARERAARRNPLSARERTRTSTP